MKTRQKVSVIVFLAGFAALFYFGGEMLAKHTAWDEFRTPAGVGDIFGLLFSVTLAIGGALGINIFDLIRQVTGNQQDRRADS